MRPWFTLINTGTYLTVFMTLVIFTACSDTEPYKIGFIGSFTGQFADIGIAGRDGVILGIEEFNKNGGIKGKQVHLIIKNHHHDPKTAVQAMQEFAQEGVSGIIGPMTSTMALILAPLADELAIPMISPTASSSELSGKKDFFLRVYPSNAHVAKNVAEYAATLKGYTRIAVIYDTSNAGYSATLSRHFETFFTGYGGTISVLTSYSTKDHPDFLQLTDQLLASAPDAIYIIAGARDTAMICQQLAKRNERIPVLTSEWSITPEIFNYGGDTINGVEFFQLFNPQDNSPKYIDFKKNYTHRFSHDPGFAPIHSYEATQVLLAALRKSTDPSTIPETITGIGTFHGLQNDFIINAFGDALRPYYLKAISDGTVITLKR
ncbi:ABC transporter substrate-binding protein [Desulfopila sp. IMCC35008]|uniref:ABC transporter substrate-binding protein n=1 Tax=Desulfopila sp. IMCC35008 TaxID=2653858 RepID=UPI0013D17D38|nr:ABC transporter substrate-binding protein [Desulfopila sp. IMCC35008]